MSCAFVGPQVLYLIWKLEWFCQGGVAVLSGVLQKVTGNRQVCKMDTEPINKELLLQQRNYKDIFLSLPCLLKRNHFQKVSALSANFRGVDISQPS